MTTTTAHSPLSTPKQNIDADVVIYDGNCRFCCRQVKRLARWDKRGRLAFLSLHSPEIEERFPDLSHDELMEQMYLVDRRGKRYAGAAAFRYLTRKLRRLWALAPFLHIPFTLPLWQWVYRRIAKRRYQLGESNSCDSESCNVHFR